MKTLGKSRLTFGAAALMLLFALLPAAANGALDEEQSTVEIGDVSDPMAKYDEPITVSTYFEIEPPLVEFFTKDRIMNNVFQKRYREELGINLEYKWFANQSDEDSVQKKNIAIASGDIPDFMMVNKEQLALLSKTDLINKDMGVYFDKYASDHLKEWMYQEGSAAMDSATFNGQIIAIPQLDSSIDTAPFLWLRKDWLDKLGLDVPETMDDLYKVMVAFRDNDPDGNGRDDTIGLILQKDIMSTRGTSDAGDGIGLFNGFGAYPRAWVEKGGELVYGSVQPEMKEALAYMNKLYSEGLIEQDFGVKDLMKASELAASGTAGVQYGAMWNAMWPLGSTLQNNPEADWEPFVIPSATGKPAEPQIKLNVVLYFVVNKNCEHPEALIKLLNFFVEKFGFSDEEEYANYLVTDTGIPSFALHDTMFKTYNALRNLEAYWKVSEAFEMNDPSSLNAEQLNYYNAIVKYKGGDLSLAGSDKTYGENGAFKAMDYYYQNDLFMMDQFYGAPTNTMKRKLQTIKDKEIEYFTKVIMGVESLDNFDDFAQTLGTLGLDQITEEVNAWYSGR